MKNDHGNFDIFVLYEMLFVSVQRSGCCLTPREQLLFIS
jgi:hypothetical protein